MLKSGDIVLLDFSYTNRVGSKVRPGLVISNAANERFPDINVAYMTTEVDSYIYDKCAVHLGSNELAEGRIKQDSVIRVDKIDLLAMIACH